MSWYLIFSIKDIISKNKCNPNILGGRGRKIRSSNPGWTIDQIPGSPGLHKVFMKMEYNVKIILVDAGGNSLGFFCILQ